MLFVGRNCECHCFERALEIADGWRMRDFFVGDLFACRSPRYSLSRFLSTLCSSLGQRITFLVHSRSLRSGTCPCMARIAHWFRVAAPLCDRHFDYSAPYSVSLFCVARASMDCGMRTPNERTSGNGAVALWFQIRHFRHAVPAQHR